MSEWRIAILLAVALRLFYSGVAALFGLYLPVDWQLIHSNALTESLSPPNHSAEYLLLRIWERFDTLWYLHIARYGYDRPDAVVFYPLYPRLIKLGSFLSPPIIVALVISTVGAFFIFWGFQVLLRPEIMRAQLRRSLVWYVLWPSSFIFFAAYPESLLLAFMLWSLYFARKGNWLAAVVLAVAAELTKAAGVIVLVPLLIFATRRRSANALWLLAAPLGALAFPAWVRWSGHGAISAVYGDYWRTVPSPPWATLWVAIHAIVHRFDVLLAFNFVSLIIICVFVGLARIRLEYKLFAIAAILLFLCKQTSPPLQSMMRYVLIVFPAFVGLGQMLGKSLQERISLLLWATVFAVNLALLWQFLGWSLIL